MDPDEGPHRRRWSTCSVTRSGLPIDPPHRHQRQDEHGPHDRRAAASRFGLRTGRFTSPHLEHDHRTDRAVDGEPVDARTFVEAYDELVPYFDLVDGQFDTRLSFFEVITALAYAIFADAPVDVAVVEVGLGGEWDATNVIDAEIAVVTPIDLDHTAAARRQRRRRSLGRRPESSRPDATAILAAQPTDAAAELLRRAADVGATVAREGLEFGVLDRQVAVGGQLLRAAGPRR